MLSRVKIPSPRAAVLAEPGRIRLETLILPIPGPAEIRIRVEGCGVCASNLEAWVGAGSTRYPCEPGDPGHESWGIVDEIGPGVNGLTPGDHVVALCARSYADYDCAPAALVVQLPTALAGQPFPGEPLGCAMNIFRRGSILAGHSVAIVGIGFQGALLAQLAVRAGAQVIAISRRASSLALARRMGAVEAIAAGTGHREIVAQVNALTAGRGCDRVIEAVGQQCTLDLASALVGAGGRLIVAGYHQTGERRVDMRLWNWKGIDVVNAHERDPTIILRGIREAIEAVSSGLLDPSPLYTHFYALEDLAAALNATRDKPPGFVKALVLMG
jgi:threonine dehydrogenase-like Zn-dependent dehydrogenase